MPPALEDRKMKYQIYDGVFGSTSLLDDNPEIEASNSRKALEKYFKSIRKEVKFKRQV